MFHTIRKICKQAKGSISILTLLMMLIFSAMGLGMIYISQAHLALSGSKRNSQLLEQACENGIKIGYGQLSELLSSAFSPAVMNSDEWQKLKEDSITGGTETVETILHEKVPISRHMTWEDQIWDLLISFKQNKHQVHCGLEFVTL